MQDVQTVSDHASEKGITQKTLARSTCTSAACSSRWATVQEFNTARAPFVSLQSSDAPRFTASTPPRTINSVSVSE
jgi:hypothetical protein